MKKRFAIVGACTVLSLAGCGGDSGPCGGIACSGHGTCYVEPPGLAICDCDPGYHNDMLVFCYPDDPLDPCRDVTCTGHGTCVVVAGHPTCSCDDGYHPAEEEPTACVPDPLDAAVEEDRGGDEDGRDEAADEPGDEGMDDVADAEAEAGPVCGNGVVETGENCEPGQSRGCESCGHEDCRSDCSGYGNCTDMGRCNPGDVWACGECGTMVCSDECDFPIYTCEGPESCLVDETEVCGSCGVAGTDLCYRACAGRRTCTYKTSMTGCTWNDCTRSGGCSPWECT